MILSSGLFVSLVPNVRCTKWVGSGIPTLCRVIFPGPLFWKGPDGEREDETAVRSRNRMAAPVWLASLLFVGSLGAYLGPCASGLSAQSSSSQAQPAQTQPAQDADIPDAPTVQPSTAEPEPPPIPKPEEKKPATVDRNPWTNQPNTPPANTPVDTGAAPGDAASPPPPMPPVKTLPPGTSAKTSPGQDQLYTLVVHTNFVQLPAR